MKYTIMRNIKFYSGQAQKIVGLMTMFGIGYTLLFSLLMGQDINYMFLILIVSSLVAPYAYIRQYLPMTISFGATRREAALGFQTLCIMSNLELLLITVVFQKLVNAYLALNSVSLGLLFGMTFLFIGVSQIIGSLTLYWGNKALIVILVFIGVFAGGFAYIKGISGLPDFLNNFVNYIEIILCAVGAVVYLISVFVLVRRVEKYEVRYA